MNLVEYYKGKKIDADITSSEKLEHILPLLDNEQSVPSTVALRDNHLTVLAIRNYLDRLPAGDFVRLVCSLLLFLSMIMKT